MLARRRGVAGLVKLFAPIVARRAPVPLCPPVCLLQICSVCIRAPVAAFTGGVGKIKPVSAPVSQTQCQRGLVVGRSSGHLRVNSRRRCSGLNAPLQRPHSDAYNELLTARMVRTGLATDLIPPRCKLGQLNKVFLCVGADLRFRSCRDEQPDRTPVSAMRAVARKERGVFHGSPAACGDPREKGVILYMLDGRVTRHSLDP